MGFDTRSFPPLMRGPRCVITSQTSTLIPHTSDFVVSFEPPSCSGDAGYLFSSFIYPRRFSKPSSTSLEKKPAWHPSGHSSQETGHVPANAAQNHKCEVLRKDPSV